MSPVAFCPRTRPHNPCHAAPGSGSFPAAIGQCGSLARRQHQTDDLERHPTGIGARGGASVRPEPGRESWRRPANTACHPACCAQHSRAGRGPHLQHLDAQRHHEWMCGAAGACHIPPRPMLQQQYTQGGALSPCFCGAWQANGACPMQCTSGSPAGCSMRFQCWNGCPACLPPPQAPQCSGYKQVTCALPVTESGAPLFLLTN